MDALNSAPRLQGSSVSGDINTQKSRENSALLRAADLLSDVSSGIKRNEFLNDPGRSNQRLLDSAVSVMTDILHDVVSPRHASGTGNSTAINAYRSAQGQSTELGQFMNGFLNQLKNVKVNSIEESMRAVVTIDELEERIRKIALDGQVKPFDTFI